MGTWLLRRRDDTYYLWAPNGVSPRRVTFFFLMWGLFVFMVGLQNAQPYVRLWFLPALAEWSQVWLFEGLWMALLVIIWLLLALKKNRRRA